MPEYNVIYAVGNHYPSTVEAKSPDEAVRLIEEQLDLGNDEFFVVTNIEEVTDEDDP